MLISAYITTEKINLQLLSSLSEASRARPYIGEPEYPRVFIAETLLTALEALFLYFVNYPT